MGNWKMFNMIIYLKNFLTLHNKFIPFKAMPHDDIETSSI
jgi:hypothetical protein